MTTPARIIDLMTSSSIKKLHANKKLHPEKSRRTAWCQAARMSEMAGDVGQMGSLFAGLAAIGTLVLFFSLGHPQAGCAHLSGFSLLLPSPIPQAARPPLNRPMMST